MDIIALVIIVYLMLALQGALFKKFMFKRIDYKCEFSVSEAHEGDEISFIEVIHNKKLLPVPWLKININSSRWLEFAGAHSVVAQENRYVTSNFFLKSHQKITRRWKLKCLKRGVYSTSIVTLVGGDPLGLNTNSSPVPVDANIIVYPAMLDFEENFIPVNYVQGDVIVRRWVVDDPFLVSGTREYNSADPMNRIHWSATAKEGRLMVRKNDFTSQVSLTIFLNIQSVENEYFDSVDKNLIETGIKICATMFDRALRNGIPVRFATNGCTMDDRCMIFTDEAAGREHVRELYKILAKLQLKRIRDFEEYFAESSRHVQNSDVILITCYVTANICTQMGELLRKGNRVTLIALNSIDESLIPAGVKIFYRSGVDMENAG